MTFSRHQFGDRLARIVGEAHVAVGEDADELARLAVGAALDHRNAGNRMARLISASASASVASGKMVIGSTTMPLSKRLTLRTSSACCSGVEVAVDDADAAGLRHGDGEPRLGHRVHGRGDDRQIEADRARQPGRDRPPPGMTVRMARPQQHVVERQGFGQHRDLGQASSEGF